MDSLLDLYAKDYGLQHDPKEDSLTADEAARISGLSPDEYNGGVRRMYAEGRNSAAENAANGSRKVG